jgi:hypothetical protein
VAEPEAVLLEDATVAAEVFEDELVREVSE